MSQAMRLTVRTTIIPLAVFLPMVVLAVANLAVARPALRRPDLKGQVSSSRAVFERRIRPILAAKNPSSCAECHLSGVDLKDYVRPSEVETFVALRDQGMIDIKRPDNSRILRFLRMSRPKTPLVTQNVRAAEYTAFRDWIAAAATNPKLLATPRSSTTKPHMGPTVSNTVIRHTRIDTVLASFERNIWSQEGRCMGCHRPDNVENVKKYGERVRWFVPVSPEATMQRLIANGDINVEKPEESLLLLKPMNKVPHGGGVKMLYGDAGYKMFRAWLEDYTASIKGRYHTAKELPVSKGPALVNMDSILMVSNGPAVWTGKLLRVDVYPWDAEHNAWEKTPVATGERQVFAGNNGAPNGTNLIMFLVVPGRVPKGEEATLRSRLVPGRYLLRYYCDTTDKLGQDYTIPTDSAPFYQGQQEISGATWFGSWSNPVKVTVALTKTSE